MVAPNSYSQSLSFSLSKKLAANSSFLSQATKAWITALSANPSPFSCNGVNTDNIIISISKTIRYNYIAT